MALKEKAEDSDAPPPDDGDPREALKKKKKAKLAQQLAKRRVLMKQQEAERKLPLQLGLVLLNSVGAAVVLSMLVALALRNLDPGNPLTNPEASRFVLFLSFAIGFFLALLLLVRCLPRNWWKLADEMVSTPKFSAPSAKWGGVLDSKQSANFAPLFDTSRPSSGVPVPATLAGSRDAEEDSFEAAAVVADPAAGHIAAQGPGQAPTPPDPAADAAAKQAAAEAAAAEARQKANEQMLTFAASVAAGLKATARAIDNVGKFASQLILAGGTGVLAEKFTLSGKDAFSLLVQGQVTAGVSKIFAESFAANAEHYAQRANYRPLIDAGQAAMDGQLRGDPVLESSVAASVTAWANDDNKKLAPKIVTFLVTDIVDAGGLVERLGNLQAQRVVRAHSQAAKSAIARHAGTEIRNGGGGALATFPDPEKAIAAAKDVLTRVAAHNVAQPHLSANVRIAVHAGETAADGNGYFGATIVTAARICQLARAGQILASDMIKAFCKQQAAAFTEFGALADDLLDKPKPLFEVAWAAGIEYGDIGKTPG